MNTSASRQDIVVGVDPREDWHPAVGWAADEALRRGLLLRLVVAVPPPHEPRRPGDLPRHREAEEAATRALEAADAWVRERQPDIRTTATLLDGVPAPTLAGLTREARMVVLGSRRLNRVAEFLSAGSLAVPVSAQAHCPVAVVVRTARSAGRPPYLVVGVDGSEPSQAALALALEEAELRGCAVRAVAVWQPPVFSLRGRDAPLGTERRLLAGTVAAWAEKYPAVRVSHEVVTGSPVEALAEAAEHAEALVVGRRGDGGYLGMRLGSVVHGLLHRAPCPVITVPVEERP
ncbi:universal stress protein [Streptomyces sp. SID8356]|uniref:universal stress protein n=1 Tax=unclassified Streptomyces TaxID=2593676 RepID=UPI00037C0BA3|nr:MULTISPECIES: universal stress protein [unclassified Streptomyces]MYT38170.1 universal stress protein [Streptomyces sp. SID8356]